MNPNDLPEFLRNLSEVESIDIYKNDIVLRRSLYKKKSERNISKRDIIKRLSVKSWRRLAFVAGNTSVDLKIMATLTYPDKYPFDVRETKSHLNRILSTIRAKFKPVEYLWFMEFQGRGAPHYHILLDTCYIDSLWLTTRWFDAVGSGDERHLSAGIEVRAIRNKDGARNYMVWYSTKMSQKKVPAHLTNCGRFWGHSRGVKPKPIESRVVYGMDSLLDSMGDWKYKENVRGRLVKVLYNASEHI